MNEIRNTWHEDFIIGIIISFLWIVNCENHFCALNFPPVDMESVIRTDRSTEVSLVRFMKPFDGSRVDMWADIYIVQ